MAKETPQLALAAMQWVQERLELKGVVAAEVPSKRAMGSTAAAATSERSMVDQVDAWVDTGKALVAKSAVVHRAKIGLVR